MPIEINDIETRRFGITCAKRTDSDAPLEAVNDAARMQGVRMLSTRVDTGDLPQVHRLETDGYRLMDTLVYCRCDLTDEWQDPTPARDGRLRPATVSDAEPVGDVARAAFAGFIGHYHADPRLSDTQADAAYGEWAENSIHHLTNDNTAVVATDRDRIVGFLTLRRNSQTQFEVVLNAVKPSHQRLGIYTCLLSRGGAIAKERGGSEMIISTQINNYAVQKIWGRLGMAPYRGYYTFHKWFD